jgi:hypothetical protein
MNELGYLEDIRDALYSIATILREIEQKLPVIPVMKEEKPAGKIRPLSDLEKWAP